MKIVLIEPPHLDRGKISRFYGAFGTSKADFIWPPVELMSIAGYLKKYPDIKTVIFDAGGLKKNIDDVEAILAKEKPDMVVFSTSTTAIYSDLSVADAAKKVSANITTVAVGAHIMALPEETLSLNQNLDVAVYGDDEEVIVKNLALYKNDLSRVLGICYRGTDGTIRRTAPNTLTQNLDDLGIPAHDQVPKDIYHDFMTKNGPLALVWPREAVSTGACFAFAPCFINTANEASGTLLKN